MIPAHALYAALPCNMRMQTLDGLPAAQARVVLRETADRLLDEMAEAVDAVPVQFGYGSEVRLSHEIQTQTRPD